MNLKEKRAEEPIGISVISADFIRVGLPSPTLAPATHTNSYLVRSTQGWLLYDIGGLDEASMEPLFEAIERHCDGRLDAIVISHEHGDHHSGLRHIRARYGNTPLYAHPHVLARLRETYLGDDWVVGSARILDESTSVLGFRFWLTEGHALGHMALVDARRVLCGDMMAGFGTIVVAPPEGSMSDYFASLQRLAELGDTPCYPAHGPEFASTRWAAEAFLAHRQAREAKILAALTLELQDLEAITAAAYDDVAPALLPIAQVAALAHLIKLVSDGKAEDRGDLWRLVAGDLGSR